MAGGGTEMFLDVVDCFVISVTRSRSALWVLALLCSADHRWIDRCRCCLWFEFLDFVLVLFCLAIVPAVGGSVNLARSFWPSFRHSKSKWMPPLGIVLYGRNYVNLLPSRILIFSRHALIFRMIL